MSILDKKIIDIIKASDSIKVLGTKDKHGVVHTVFKDSIDVNEQGNIFFYEYLETSQTNKNLTYSIWFDQVVTVLIKSKDGESYQIKGKPIKVHVNDKYFLDTYNQLIKKTDELDLSGIWEIEPEEVRLETLLLRAKEEQEKYPIVGHLDRDVAEA